MNVPGSTISVLIGTFLCGCGGITSTQEDIPGSTLRSLKKGEGYGGKEVVEAPNLDRDRHVSITSAIEEGMSAEELMRVLGRPSEIRRYNFTGFVPVPEPKDPMAWDYKEIKNTKGKTLRVSVYDGVVDHWFWVWLGGNPRAPQEKSLDPFSDPFSEDRDDR